jgi:hypothetical protein
LSNVNSGLGQEVKDKVGNDPPRGKLRGIKPGRFRIALKVIRVIRVICEICGLKTGFPVKNAYFLELLSIWLKIEVSNYFVNNEIFNRENQKLCKGGD